MLRGFGVRPRCQLSTVLQRSNSRTMAAGTPTAMVSSTCFDLKQVRADLLDFIQGQAGYVPLFSELSSFPIDTDVDTIENCRRRVERDADLLILVIGGRYGFVGDKSGHSITNLEYLAARAKQIPVYAFVKRDILTALSIWEKNPTGDYGSIVDSPRLFEFVREVRTVHRVWMNEFDTAQEIVSALRVQFAHLAAEGIRWKQRLQEPQPRWLAALSGKALRLALERPRLWEYRLLVQAIRDEIDGRVDLRREHELGLSFDGLHGLENDKVLAWAQLKLRELTRLGEGLGTIFGKPVADAMGPPGEPGDPEKILFIARGVGAAYEAALKWSRAVRAVHVSEAWRPGVALLAEMVNNLLVELEDWTSVGFSKLDKAEADFVSGVTMHVDMSLKISISGDAAAMVKEFERAALASRTR